MKKERHWPEVYVDIDFLQRTDLINKILRVDIDTYNVNFEHPVLGQVIEVYHISRFSYAFTWLISLYCNILCLDGLSVLSEANSTDSRQGSFPI